MMYRQDKRILWNQSAIMALDTDPALYLLSSRDIETIANPLQAALWRTRVIDEIMSFDEWREYIAEVMTALMTPIDICSMIADCIADSPAVRDALGKYLTEYGLPKNDAGAPVGIGADNLLEGMSCDLDTIYGAAVAIEDYIYQTARDYWEVVIDSATDTIAGLRLIDYMPVIGDLPIADDINDFITQIRNIGFTAFDIGYTAGIRQENICALFNAACTDCNLSAWDVLQVYVSRGGVGFNPEDTFQILYYLIVGGTYTEDAIVALSMALVAAALAAGSSVMGRIGIAALQSVAQSGDPDGDWILFCDPCATPCPTNGIADFTASDGCFAAVMPANYGVYTQSVGWQSIWIGGGTGAAVNIQNLDMFGGASVNLISASISVDITAGGQGFYYYLDVIHGDSSTTNILSSSSGSSGTFTWNGNLLDVVGFQIAINGGNLGTNLYTVTGIESTIQP